MSVVERLRAGVLVALTLPTVACDQIMGPTAPDANWRVQTIGRFTFHVRPGSFVERHVATLAEVLEDQFAFVRSRLDLGYQGRVTVYLHPSGADAGFGDDPGGGNHSGVAYPLTETLKAVVVPPMDGNTFSLVNHELNHVILNNGLGRPGTSLLNEGLASALVSERLGAVGATFYHRWVRNRGSQPPIADLANDDKWKSFDQPVSYNSGASFLAYVLDRFGVAPLKSIYYASSSQFAERFQAAYGVPLAQIEAEWKAFLAALPPG